MKTLGIRDLDRIAATGCKHGKDEKCEDIRHNGFFIHSRCHVEAPVEAKYLKGNLHFICGACQALVIVVAVAVEGREE